ncbi:MAG: hypothetical protein WCE65_08265 [Methanoregula sp.]
MKLPTINYKSVALIAIVLSAIGLIMIPVSAAAFSPPGGSQGTSAYHHVFNSTQMTGRLQTVLTNLTQQGVDVSQAQADITVGNVTAAFQWLMAYHQANPSTVIGGFKQRAFNTQHAFNSTQQSARIQLFLTKLGSKGVDVSQPQADLTAGNVSAAMQWMAAYHTAHPGTHSGQHGAWTHYGNGSNSTLSHQGGSFRSHHAGFGNRTLSNSGIPAQGQGSTT